jgi:lactate dehydrogenase-like 2-hydroxyacid dehydrogenase
MMAKRGRPVDGSSRRYDVIVAMRERTVFDAALLESLPQLKLLVTTGMANASIDTAAAARLGVTVAGTRGIVGPAELTFGLLLSVARHIPTEAANLRAGGKQWPDMA